MQGKSADFARHAIPSILKQRILVTLVKSQPKKTTAGDGQRLSSSSHWSPPPGRSPNHNRHPLAKPYGPVPTTGVLPPPPVRPQIAPPNGIQPFFVPAAPVASAMPFPPPVALPPASAGWPAAPSRHPPPRLLVPGTGVFLPPPGSGNSSTQQLSTIATETSFSVETSPVPEKDNGLGKPNGNSSASPKGKVVGTIPQQECSRSMDGTVGGEVATQVEHQQIAATKATSNPGGTV